MKRTPKETAWRDQIATQVMSICMVDLSRQLSNPHNELVMSVVDLAIANMAAISYKVADAMLKARKQ